MHDNRAKNVVAKIPRQEPEEQFEDTQNDSNRVNNIEIDNKGSRVRDLFKPDPPVMNEDVIDQE